MNFAAKKSLGQNFLLNPSTIDKILEKAKIAPGDQVLEIGPGPGVMTERIARRAGKVIAVEKDRRFFELLQEKLAPYPQVTLIEGDFLTMDLEKLLGPEGRRWKAVANLPYNIATEVIFRLLDCASHFVSLHLMVQKEVADRLIASPGSKDYGILSVFAQLHSNNRIVTRLPPGAFTPPPKVDSAVVEFQISDGCRFDILDLARFKAVVRAAFGQRRKTIANALKAGLQATSSEKILGALEQADIPPMARAETVSIEKFATLANVLSDAKD